MATAHIILQQSGDGYTTPGSRDDLILGSAVTMLNQNNSGAVSWAWIMVDRPTGSNATIASPTASTTTFTPDVVGTYLIHLSVNAGAAVDQKGAAVKTSNLHFRIPAATETIEFDGYRGWATATNQALKLLDDGYVLPSSAQNFQNVYNISSPSSFVINGTNGGLQVRDASTPTGINIFEVDAYSVGTKYFTVASASTTVNNTLLVPGSNFIGVNTSSPLYPVHVTTSGDNYSFVQTRGGVTGGLYARSTSPIGLGLGTSSNNSLFFFTNNTPGTPGMILTTTGAVGIGTVSPGAQLHVVGTGHITGALAIDGGFTAGAISSMGGFKITSLDTPTTGTDAANKSYVDGKVASSTSTLQTAYAASTPATVQLNGTNGGIIVQDAQTHLGAEHTALLKVDAYASASNYMTVYRAGQELNRESGSTAFQSTGAAVGVLYDALWGSSANDIYAVGFDSSGSKQQLAHYNSTSWTTLTTYPGAVGDTVNTVFGFSSTAVYIGAQTSLAAAGGIWFTANSGSSWTQQYSTKGITTIWGSDATHIYAGVNDNSGIVLSSNGGGTWSAVSGSVGTRFISSIWGVSATEFWVATSDSIWHTANSGTTLSKQFDTNANSTGFISIGTSVNWKSIWGTSASNVYAVGVANNKGFIAHYNGTFWTLQLQNYVDPVNIGFTSVYGTSANDIYVCGGQVLLYSNGNAAWIPQKLSASTLSGGVTLNAAWASSYNQWLIAPSATNPVSILALSPQGGHMTAPGIGAFNALITNNISTPDNGLNTANTLTFTSFVDANQNSPDVGFIFNTTSPIYTGNAANYLAIFQSAGADMFKIKGDGYLQLPTNGGIKDLSATEIISWSASAVRVHNLNIDGYAVDVSGGITSNEALVYNGTSLVPQVVAIVSANSFDALLATTGATAVATYTPSANNNFVCYMYYRVSNASTDVTISITWTDVGGSQSLTVLSTTTKTVGSYSVAPVYLQAVSGNAITISFTAGTANNVHVSATILAV